MEQRELAHIQQKLLNWGPTFEITHDGELVARTSRSRTWSKESSRTSSRSCSTGGRRSRSRMTASWWQEPLVPGHGAKRARAHPAEAAQLGADVRDHA